MCLSLISLKVLYNVCVFIFDLRSNKDESEGEPFLSLILLT